MTFKELGLNEQLLEAIGYMGFVDATPIQEQTIPMILGGNDLIACAQTGTGKTAAFLLPVLNKLANNPTKSTNTLILCPTRELAVQIEEQIQGLGYFAGVNSLAIYGGIKGDAWTQQRKALTQGANIIVATPGKLIAHMQMGNSNMGDLQHLILDEADRMLDMGFMDDIKQIVSHLPKKRQNLMFSATMPPKIRKLAKELLTNPKEVTLELSKPAEGVLQAVYLAHDHQKVALINTLIKDKPQYTSILVFSSTKKKVNEIIRGLRNKQYLVEGISSDFEQIEREKVLARFRRKETRVLVATDVLSRGIDIKDISLVINFDVPGDAEDYVHRIGRTARAQTTGVALTLVNQEDMYKMQRIEKLIEAEVPRVAIPVELGEAPVWKVSKGRGNYKRGGKGGSKGGSKSRSKGGNYRNKKKK